MCGVVGYVGDPGPEDGLSLLRGLCGALRHRGPDDDGVLLLDGAGLGHTRLAVVDIEGGRQPMASRDGHVSVSFNGEIFNYVELRRELEDRGRHFRTTSDTEVLLQLYEEYGPDCVRRLNGDFAFAIWDARQRRMVMARDRIGVRPLFVTRRAGLVVFASEIKALLTVPGVRAEIDPIALDQIFTLWAPIPPRTAFKNIEELPPAHMLIVEDGRASLSAYWELAFPRRGEVRPARDEAAWRDEVRALLEDATAIRMRSDVPVGAYLSGGLDSAAVAALAARLAPAGLNTFSVTFDSAEHDESAFQAVMVDRLGTRHRSVACGGGAIARAFAAVVAHAERPILRTAPAPLYLLSGLVRESGMKVVLTGEGADEIFAGYDLFKEAKLRRFCARQPASRRRPQLLRRLYPYLPGLQQQTPESLAAFFGSDADMVDDPLHSHRPRLRGTAATKMFFGADLRATLRDYDAAAELVSRLPEAFREWHPLHQAQYLETRFLLPGYILSSQGDRMAMAHGVEGRFPFLDHRLVELAATIPPEMKLRGLREKHILREAVRDCLPAAILDRPKQPYRAPDSAAFFAPGEPDTVSALLEPEAVRAAGLFNPAAVARLADKCRRGRGRGFRDNAAFVGILSTQLWHRTFVERRESGALPRPRATAL